jgi:hypothetical protein
VRLRGIEYTDDLVRADSGWLIRRRRHAPCWESVTEPTAMPVSRMRRSGWTAPKVGGGR